MLSAYISIGYALLVIIGGVIGYATARSRASLIAGTASGVLMLIAAMLQLQNVAIGLPMAVAISLGLTGVFLMRYRKTQKVMPSGVMAAVSLLVFLALLIPKLFS